MRRLVARMGQVYEQEGLRSICRRGLEKLCRPDWSQARHARGHETWHDSETAFLAFLNKWDLTSAVPGARDSSAGSVAVVLQPWVNTPVPWFMTVLALGMMKRGRNVVIIWDDLPSDFAAEAKNAESQQASIFRILASLAGRVDYVKLSDFPMSHSCSLPRHSIESMADANTLWHARKEDTDTPKLRTYHAVVAEHLTLISGRIKNALGFLHPEVLVVAGGKYGSSGVFMHVGKTMGLRVASFDSGPGVLLLSDDGVAAHLTDIPRAFEELPEEDNDMVQREAQEEMGRRMMGSDAFSSQTVAATGQDYSCDLVMPLNLSYDAAALGLHRIFKSQKEGILETTAWFLANNAEGRIAIRRHPCERVASNASHDDYRQCLLDKFGENPRIWYISEKDKINTYDVMARARAVVPYCSTVGVEAAALGKPVVTEGANYYAGLGFVWSAGTRVEYFALLKRAIDGELVVTSTQRKAALKCYYLTQCCNFLRTSFTPQPGDYAQWSRTDPDELMRDESVITFLAAIDQNIPLSLLQHESRKRKIHGR